MKLIRKIEIITKEDIKEIKIGFFNFLDYIKERYLINKNLIKNFLKFHLYEKYKNYQNYKDILEYESHDHFIELIILIKRKLELLQKKLNTDYTRDEQDMQRLSELIKLADNLIIIIKENGLVEKHPEYQKLSKSFFNKLYRLHDKLWYNYQNLNEIKDLNETNS